MDVRPDELDQLARANRAQAGELRQEARAFLAQSGGSEWEGPAANRFRADAQTWLRNIEHAASELESVAADMQREAETVRTELRELARIEAAVRAAASSGQIQLAIKNFPPPGDPEWRNLGRQVGIG